MIIDEWNKIISSNLTILHLGDVAFKEGYKLAEKLNGKVTLLVGNHDKDTHVTYYKSLGWNIINKIDLQIQNPHKIMNTLNKEFSKEMVQQPLLACLVCDIDNKRVMFSHFPVFDDNPYDVKFSSVTNILNRIFELSNCDINIQKQFVDYNEDLFFTDIDLFNEKMVDWLIKYNTFIPHHSLQMKTPVQYLLNSNP
jgi:calcineurin-like phosphoesterase family protein